MKIKFIILTTASICFGVQAGIESTNNRVFSSEIETAIKTVDFENDLIPMFTKMGCNAGQCHGSAIGRGEFKLSLYGGSPEADYQEIVRAFAGRRINLVDPESSLIFMKPAEQLEHGGGGIFSEDDQGAQLLLDWIQQGAKHVKHRQLTRVEVSPKKFAASEVGNAVRLKAVAHYDDGSMRDVTDWTQFVAEDASAVSIDPASATAAVMRRGRHIVVSRYLSEVIPIELVVPMTDSIVDFSTEPRVNIVDEEVLKSLADLRLPVSPPANDATFLRRITLDLTGRLPQDQFETESSELNREAVVDQLLASESFVDFYTLKLAKLLRVRSKGDKNMVKTTPEAARGFHQWIADQLRNGVGYDQMARDILTASGDTTQYGPAVFFVAVEDARLQTEFATEVFMGSRMKCANCHNHPLDKWTQDDFHGLSAIFSKLTRGQVIRLNPIGKNIHPKTGEPARMKIPGEDFLPTSMEDGREAFADWLTARDNPYFSKSIVNRLWKSLMGRGLVEPVDDFRSTNPATHPVLLDKLADDFVEHGYDIRHALKVIAMSSTYARSSNPVAGNEADDRFYSHMVQKPLEPEVLADAISDVLGVASRFGDEQEGTRAVELLDGSIQSSALDILGRCDRGNSCEGAPSPVGPLAQKLHLFNGELLNSRVGVEGGRLDGQLKANRSPAEIVQRFYQAALNRLPNQKEREFLSQWIDDQQPSAKQRDALEDFVWSIVTCKEFVTNH